jgi:hypothetical protein
VIIPAIMPDVEEVEVVVAHSERATLRVGHVFLKIDTDQTRTNVEVESMAMAPIPATPPAPASPPWQPVSPRTDGFCEAGDGR